MKAREINAPAMTDPHRLRFYRKHGSRSKNPKLCTALERNIEALAELKRQADESRSVQEKLADWITDVSGSMAFVYAHAVWFLVWISWNVGAFGAKPFDPFPFGLLTMIVSLEAIFLATFVLISQNRMAKLVNDRADLDLQINILDEHEVTQLLRLVDAIAVKLGIETKADPELQELERDVSPVTVMEKIAETRNENH